MVKILREPIREHPHLGPMQEDLARVGILSHMERRVQEIPDERGATQSHESHHLVIPIGEKQVRETLQILFEQGRLKELAETAKIAPPENGMSPRQTGQYLRELAARQNERIETFSKIREPEQTPTRNTLPSATTPFASRVWKWIRNEQQGTDSRIENPRQDKTPTEKRPEPGENARTTGGRLVAKLREWLRPQQELNPALERFSPHGNQYEDEIIERTESGTGKKTVRRWPRPKVVMISDRPVPVEERGRYRT